MNKFYVYRHLRLDTLAPFYVGKGKLKRSTSRSGRNRYWHNIVNAVGFEVEIIATGLDEKDAFEKEVEFIGIYKKLGLCEANLSMGGDGGTTGIIGLNKGRHVSAETRKKIADSLRGKPSWNAGRRLSREHRNTLSKAHMGHASCRRKRVIDESGTIYKSVTEASRKMNIKRTTLNAMLVGQNNNTSGVKFLE
jgi:hypothetical protein